MPHLLFHNGKYMLKHGLSQKFTSSKLEIAMW